MLFRSRPFFQPFQDYVGTYDSITLKKLITNNGQADEGEAHDEFTLFSVEGEQMGVERPIARQSAVEVIHDRRIPSTGGLSHRERYGDAKAEKRSHGLRLLLIGAYVFLFFVFFFCFFQDFILGKQRNIGITAVGSFSKINFFVK